MNKKINIGFLSFNLVIYMFLLGTLFAFIKTPGEGHIIPWVLAIVSGFGSIFHLGFKFLNKKGVNFMTIAFFLIIINIFMIIFSILDIAHIDNHFISTIIFILAPAISYVILINFWKKL